MELVTARGEPASTSGPPNSTAGTCWTTFSGTMGLIQHNGTRRWPCWPVLCQGAKRGLSHRPRQGAERSRCPRVPVLRGGKGRRSRRHNVGWMGLQRRLLREQGDKCVERRSRGIDCYICRIQADGGGIRR